MKKIYEPAELEITEIVSDDFLSSSGGLSTGEDSDDGFGKIHPLN